MEIDSTSEMLARLDKLNLEIRNGGAVKNSGNNSGDNSGSNPCVGPVCVENSDVNQIESNDVSDGQWAKGDIRNYGRRGVKTKTQTRI